MVHVLQELAATGEQFDLVFIDADKQNYINYYKFLMDHNLLRMDGVICVDNTLFKGRVYLKDSADEMGIALRDFSQFVTNDPRVEQVCVCLKYLLYIKILVLVLQMCNVFTNCLKNKQNQQMTFKSK